MKVLLVNGSSRPDGCTATALKRVSDTLAAGLRTLPPDGRMRL